MCILMPVVAAVIIVFLGYIALWTASQKDIPEGVAKFGRILAIILYVFAGLVLIGGVAKSHFKGHGRMGCKCEMGEMREGRMHGQMGWHKGDKEGMECCKGQMDEKGQMGAAAPMEKEGKGKK